MPDAKPAFADDQGSDAPRPGALPPLEQLSAVYDIPVQLAAVLGRTSMPVSQLLRLGRGAVVELDRKVVRAYAEKFSWRASADQFVENLQPYPEPERGRFWRRLRRIARIRNRAAA